MQRQLEREAERDMKAREAADRAAARDAAHARSMQGVLEAERRTGEIEACIAELSSILIHGLTRSSRIDLQRLRRASNVSPLDLNGLDKPLPPPDWTSFQPAGPTVMGKMFGGQARYLIRLEEAEAAFAAAQEEHRAQEVERQTRVRTVRREHAEAVTRTQALADAYNHQLEEWASGLRARSAEHVNRYLEQVLSLLPVPENFPRHYEVTFSSRDEEAVIRFELPSTTVIPAERVVTYVKARDEFVSKPRLPRDAAALYRSIIGQVTLLAIRDLFEADPALRKVSFNGHVTATNRATGRSEYPCLLSVIVDRDEFSGLVLDAVSAEDCLRHLKALVSQHPYAVEPVRPLVDFDRTRYAFIEGIDVVAELDHRDDLMTLTPTEFEHLVRQVFESSPGMQGWTTRPSKDDGVDAVIFNATPITGGLTVVQAKQYTNSIGVQHVRELLGTMEDKKAGRGVLVTTSTFTKDAYILSERLGRIQLINGQEFVYLIKELLGKDVVIGNRPKKTP